VGSLAVSVAYEEDKVSSPAELSAAELTQNIPGRDVLLRPLEQQIEKAAKLLTSKGVDVYCASTGYDVATGRKHAGEVHYTTNLTPLWNPEKIVIDTPICDIIMAASSGEFAEQYNQAQAITASDEEVTFALFVVAHEIGHVDRGYDEGVANCAAIELYPEVAQALSIEPPLTTDDFSYYVREQDLPSEYHSKGC
jgi:hypothetical protein